MTVQGRTGARLLALALATGTLVATAGAASAAAPAPAPQLVADGAGSALELTINLPAGVSLPGIGSTITHKIALTKGGISTVDGASALTSALLGEGTTPVLSQLLAGSTSASTSGKREDSRSAAPAVDQAGLQVALLPLLSKVADPATTVDGVLAQSSSGVAKVAVTGNLLPAQLAAVTAPVQQVLAPALAQTTGAADQATETVAQTVSAAIDQLNSALAPTPAADASAPVTGAAKDAVTDAVDTLTDTLTGLTDTLTRLDTATSLVTLDALTSDQTITRKGDAVTSTVANTVKSLDVLGGLVSVDAITSRASATAGGTKGSGKADFVAPVLDVKVADGALGFRIDDKGPQLTGLVTDALPADLKPVVDGALGSVNQLLAQVAGVSVEYGKGVTTVAPDGSAARSEVSATTLVVNPAPIAALLPAGKQFLTVKLVGAQASAGSRLVAAPVAAPATTPVSLPRTGGGATAGLVATALAAVALVVRRRRVALEG